MINSLNQVAEPMTTQRSGKELWKVCRKYFIKQKADEVLWKCPCGWTNSGSASFTHCAKCRMTCPMRQFVKRISIELSKKEMQKALEKKNVPESPRFSISEKLFF